MNLLINIFLASKIWGLVFAIVEIISRFIVFKKMDIPGWKSLIPVYSGYLEYKKLWTTGMWWLTLGLLVGGIYMNRGVALMYTDMRGLAASWLGLIMMIVSVVLIYQFYKKLANGFGKEDGFALGLMLFPSIFYGILAFSKCEFDMRKVYR